MSAQTLLVAIPAVLLATTLAAPLLAGRLGARAGHLLAVGVAASGALLLALLPQTLAGPVVAQLPWIPSLGASWSLRLDPLSFVFALMVLGVGAVVLSYSAGYLEHDVEAASYYTLLTGFATAMALLVLAGDALALYVGWEGTTFSSFGLIAGAEGGRRPAVRALLLTFGGGLALLAAILVGSASLGTLGLSELADAAAWTPTGLRVFLLLLVVAAAAKSAQLPFHVWLPGAMIAPTPVSAYLHAAAMVTAGLYLLLRFAGTIAADPFIGAVVVALGTVTAVFAAATAVRRDDLKELLAYSTISQLGFMIALVGVGTRAAIGGAIVYVLAHAAYKSSLFLSAGVYDHVLGSRRLGDIGGSAGRLPWTAGAVLVAGLSMAGVPPALGYVGKEEALKGLLEDAEGGQLAAAAGIGLALLLTVAYTVRVVAAAIRRRPDGGGAPVPTGHGKLRALAIGPAVLAGAGIVLGLYAAHLTPLVDGAVEAALGASPEEPIGLWHGVTPAFIASVAILVAGGAVFALWRERGWWVVLPDDAGSRAVDALGRWLRTPGDVIARAVTLPRPVPHLAAIVTVASVGIWLSLAASPDPALGPRADSASRWVVSLLLIAATLAVASARDRLTSLATLAGVGFSIAAWYVLHGAPQLAAVQLVVDGLTIALAAFVVRQLPREYPRTETVTRLGAGALAILGGTAFAGLSLYARAAALPPASGAYLDEARASGAGNVVSSVLTEYRALDTLLETTVVAVAAMGVSAVLRSRERQP